MEKETMGTGINLAERECMTEREQLVVESILSYQRQYGFAPSVRELCVLSGLSSTSSVDHYLKRLEKKGYLTRKAFSPRAMAVL